jgi:hypothetical protein
MYATGTLHRAANEAASYSDVCWTKPDWSTCCGVFTKTALISLAPVMSNSPVIFALRRTTSLKLEALDDQSLFGRYFRGESWTAWRAFLMAAFGLPMDDSSQELFRVCTGRAAVPTGQISEAALIVGRRGGKSRILALIAVYLACFRGYAHHLAPG